MNINYAAIDWVTATTRKDSVGLRWFEIFQSFVDERNLKNLYNERWSNGYYSGISCEGLSWGYNDRLGYIIIASSEDADWLWPKIEIASTRITRLDLCVDCLYESPRDLAGTQYDYITATLLPKQRKYTHFKNSAGGQTLYVGSRHSQQYGRLYDKGAESSQAPMGRLWRYEVEYKKPLSGMVGEHLRMQDADKLESEIINRVSNWFYERGVLSADHIREGAVKPILVQKTITSVEKKLAWLRTQVAPTVHQLIEAGWGDDVLHSLLLQPSTIANILNSED